MLKLSIAWVIFAFCAVISEIPDATARGNHAGGHHVNAGSHGGHSGHIGDHGRLGSGHRHFGSHSHSGIGRRNFGGGQGHLGTGHSHFGSGHRHFRGEHTRHFGGYRQYYRVLEGGYNYANPLRFYSPRPYSYPYPYPFNSLHSLGYLSFPSFPSYPGDNNYPKSYAGSSNTYRYNSTDTRYPDTATGTYSTNDLGWRLLAQSNPRGALDVFATQAGQHQTDGVPKVGYALSAAMQGDLNKAAWAMRRAFSIDPDSLHYLKIDASLRASIDGLLTEYHNQLKYAQGNRHFDVAFMIAALNYLVHEQAAARIAIEKLVAKLGDNSQSAQNLHRLVVNNEY